MNADPEELYYHVEFITSLQPPRSYRNPESLDKTARYPDLKDVFPSEGNFIVLVDLEEQRDFVDRFYTMMGKSTSRVPVFRMLYPPDEIVLAGMSDHVSYWDHGFRALIINDTSFFCNSYYHTKNNTIDTLDFARMADVVNGACLAILRY